ncbi:calcium-activated BK potassium channel [Pelomyxa schiedti]|nr:calcium-activated BK potassium channel [Pelomyxa schiedti]
MLAFCDPPPLQQEQQAQPTPLSEASFGIMGMGAMGMGMGTMGMGMGYGCGGYEGDSDAIRRATSSDLAQLYWALHDLACRDMKSLLLLDSLTPRPQSLGRNPAVVGQSHGIQQQTSQNQAQMGVPPSRSPSPSPAPSPVTSTPPRASRLSYSPVINTPGVSPGVLPGGGEGDPPSLSLSPSIATTPNLLDSEPVDRLTVVQRMLSEVPALLDEIQKKPAVLELIVAWRLGDKTDTLQVEAMTGGCSAESINTLFDFVEVQQLLQSVTQLQLLRLTLHAIPPPYTFHLSLEFIHKIRDTLLTYVDHSLLEHCNAALLRVPHTVQRSTMMKMIPHLPHETIVFFLELLRLPLGELLSFTDLICQLSPNQLARLHLLLQVEGHVAVFIKQAIAPDSAQTPPPMTPPPSTPPALTPPLHAESAANILPVPLQPEQQNDVFDIFPQSSDDFLLPVDSSQQTPAPTPICGGTQPNVQQQRLQLQHMQVQQQLQQQGLFEPPEYTQQTYTPTTLMAPLLQPHTLVYNSPYYQTGQTQQNQLNCVPTFNSQVTLTPTFPSFVNSPTSTPPTQSPSQLPSNLPTTVTPPPCLSQNFSIVPSAPTTPTHTPSISPTLSPLNLSPRLQSSGPVVPRRRYTKSSKPYSRANEPASLTPAPPHPSSAPNTTPAPPPPPPPTTPTSTQPSPLSGSLSLKIARQPPNKTVYQRILRPFPSVMMIGPTAQLSTENLFIEATLWRSDNETELPTFLEGTKIVRISAGVFATFKRLKILCTTQQQGTQFCVRFTLKHYIGNDFFTVQGATALSDPIEVFSHTLYLNERKEASGQPAPTVIEVLPQAGPPGTRVVVLGTNFLNTPALRVAFNDSVIIPTFHEQGTLICTVPHTNTFATGGPTLASVRARRLPTMKHATTTTTSKKKSTGATTNKTDGLSTKAKPKVVTVKKPTQAQAINQERAGRNQRREQTAGWDEQQRAATERSISRVVARAISDETRGLRDADEAGRRRLAKGQRLRRKLKDRHRKLIKRIKETKAEDLLSSVLPEGVEVPAKAAGRKRSRDDSSMSPAAREMAKSAKGRGARGGDDDGSDHEEEEEGQRQLTPTKKRRTSSGGGSGSGAGGRDSVRKPVFPQLGGDSGNGGGARKKKGSAKAKPKPKPMKTPGGKKIMLAPKKKNL